MNGRTSSGLLLSSHHAIYLAGNRDSHPADDQALLAASSPARNRALSPATSSLAALQGEATARAIRLSEFVNTPLYVVHVMSRDAMEEVARAR